MDPVVAQPGQPAPGRLAQGLDNLQGVDLMAQLGQHGRLITGTGAKLKYLARLLQAEQIGHQRHDIGLGDGLAMPDGQRAIGVGCR